MSEVNNRARLTGRQTETPDRREIARKALRIFLLAFVLTLAVTAAILFVGNNAEMTAIWSEERHTVAIQAANIDADIQQVSSDLMILAHGRTMRRLWDEDGAPLPEALADLTDDYLNITMNRRLYDQVRLIDENGLEIVRVNFNNGHPAVVPKEKLQDKKDRYYFQDAFELNRGEVFVSRLDLNIEHGEIERPLKPMIRFATPVFDQRGEKRGIMLLNYHGAILLDHFYSQTNVSERNQAMLLNGDGYWLKGPSPDDEWGFMYEDRRDRTFASAYPDAWERIKSEESCQFETPQGMFTSRTVYPLSKEQKSSTGSDEAFASSQARLEAKDYNWKVVSFVPSDTLYAARDYRRKLAASVLALLAMVWLWVAWWLAKSGVLRIRAEDALRTSEQKHRLIADNATDVIWTTDVNLKYTYFSPSVERIRGYTTEEALARSVEESMTPASFRVAMNLFQQEVKLALGADYSPDKTATAELELTCKDGSTVWTEVSMRFLFDDERNPVGVLGISRDITERKRAQEKVDQLAAFGENNPDPLLRADWDGKITIVNPAARTLFDRDVIGESIDSVLPGSTDSISKTSQTSAPKQFERRLRDELYLFTIHRDETTLSIYIYGSNITETKRLQELESRAERLETAGTIAGQVAHDFNNLLAPIVAYPEFIHEELPYDSKAHAYLDTIEVAAKKIADINQDLLTMGRRGHYNLEVLDLNRVVLQSAQEMESRTETVTVELELCEDLMKIKGGAAQIHRMLSNLLVNAQDAMEDKGHVTIKTENYLADDTALAFGRVPMGEYVKLTISDSGCGIPENITQRILDPFFSTKTTDKKRGSGLGLSVVDAVIKDHEGYLDLSSKVGQGTSFYLYFPVTREGIGEDASEHLAGGTETVLVVDDDDIQREVSSQLLVKLGYEVATVSNGEKAIVFLQKNPQNLVILDMVMPRGIDGAETYKRILHFNPHQKAIVLSGFSESDQVLEAQKLGAGAFVRKPVTKSILAAAVRTELDRRVAIAAF